MFDSLKSWVAAVAMIIVAGGLVLLPAQAQNPPPPGVANGTQRISMNFKDTDIGLLAEAVSMATGKTFIVDPRVRAQVNLVSSQPGTAQEFYQAFLSVLQVHGFVAVQAGNIVKIVPDANVRAMPSNDLPDRIPGGSDEMVTQVITVKNTNAAQLVQVLRPLVAQYGHLQAFPGSNSLIVSDRASNVARIMKIIARVDQAGDANIEVIPLQNSTAADVVRTITALTAGQPAAEAGGMAPKVVADDRSNSILLSGEKAQRLRITTLIAHLDTPVADGGDTQVRYLRYADAEKIAPKLKEQVTGVAQAAAGGAASPAAAADRSTTIWADTETNSLIVTAPPKTMRSLMTIIDRLDIRRAQVLVEAIIVDVSTNKSADLGVNWAVFSNEAGTNVPVGGFIQPIAGSSIVNLAQTIANPTGATPPSGATIGIGRLRDSGVNFGAMIRALRTDDNVNVIATPTATMMDNQEAILKVAQEVPFITGQYTNGGTTGSTGSVNPFTTIQREEVGTILKITPQINGGDAMMLKIELESSELAGSQGDANSLITNKRTINTTVLIEDGGVIVLGGLIRDSKNTGETRVPYLGRIPLIGEAFKVRSGKRNKSNLMVFIRPKILNDGIQTSIETNAKYNSIRNEQRLQGPNGELLPLFPFDQKPLLPPPPPTPATLPAAPPEDTTAPRTNQGAAEKKQ
ncbi:MAG: type II secretion system secretin GspD [Steroidobacteraceae bacterium]